MADTSALKSVIVIGAGISGLSAAKRLINHGGFHVTVLEASDRIGGRIHTAEFGSNNVEIGAQWVHGETGNRIFEIANANGLLDIEKTDRHKKFAETSIFVTQDGDFLKEGIHDKIAKLMDLLHDESFHKENSETDEVDIGSLSVKDVATQAFWSLNEETLFHEDHATCAQILDWIHRLKNSIDGADHWSNTSLIGESEYKQCDGNPTISWKNPANYSSLLEIILNSTDDSMTCNWEELEGSKYSASNIPSWIMLEKEVTTIQYSSNEAPLSIICKDGSYYNCDYSICTISLGVLKDCHKTLFKPGLPHQKVNAIEHIGFGTVDKIFLEFRDQWWPTECDGFNLLWDMNNQGNWSSTATTDDFNKIDEHCGLPIWARSLLGFYVVPFQPNVLVTWITGEPARHMERLDLEELKRVLFGVLKKFPGRVFNVPEPLLVKRSTWFTNPFSRGSYSYRQMSTESNDAWAVHLADPILHDDKPVLCFAGEATHSCFYSTVHGGFESGVREADRIIAHSQLK